MSSPLPTSRAPLYWMALGSFAVGTESFMIAAILPDIAADLSVSEQAAGQLVSIFALTYAASSPVLTAATGAVSRRLLLIVTMLAFVAANVVAAVATSYTGLMAARVLLAMAAGLFVPNANALAGTLVPPAERGRALSIVTSGLSLAIVFGVPLGAVVGNSLGWRMTFGGVAALAVVAVAGLFVGLPRSIGASTTVVSLGARLEALKNPAVRRPLAIMTLWAMGPFTTYPYLATYLQHVTGLEGAAVGAALFAWGIAAFVGLTLGGRANDRLGSKRVVGLTLPAIALALAGLSLTAYTLPPSLALVPAFVAIMVWGFAAWAFYPAQQARLISIVGPQGASIILSVNASFHYFGFSVGAALGALVLSVGGVRDLGWVGALCVAAACALEYMPARKERPAAAPLHSAKCASGSAVR
ncbi:MFS transporter [Azospirillum rugosum]|uniref:MFS family arabinose efflux permease n=1 Tax=Azospirillum rugosum TaxID=416170 RepID=A0ABS4SHH8_9PROT|nr:MFS transporter [Azospirillum rugosum]MBP2292037.1 putative MFS family arabinose efflux permease [Azospirillum rugosum]MDQ0525827.1 putative MFS family arabinose efflux permease [Azospirillum rugosum]